MQNILKKLAFYAGVLAVWQVVVELKVWPPYLFPSPLAVLESLRAGIADQSFLIAVGVSMKRILVGYAISVLGGIVLGVLLVKSKFLDTTLGALVLSLQSLPSMCWLPMAVLWFGLTEKAIVFVVVMGSLLSMTISTQTGLAHVPKLYQLAARNLGASGFRLFWHVMLPASFPHLLVGLKQGWAFAWRSLIGGEMLFVSLGLGHLLMMGRDLNDMSQVIAVMGLIMLLGYLVDRTIFVTLHRRVRRRWGGIGSAAIAG